MVYPTNDITKNLITRVKYVVVTMSLEEFDDVEAKVIKTLKNAGIMQSPNATERKRKLCGRVFRIERVWKYFTPEGDRKLINVIDGTDEILPGYLVKEILDDDIAKEKYPELYL